MSWKSLNEMFELGLISRGGNRMNNILVNTGINDYINIVYVYGHWYNVENLHLQLNPNEKKYDVVDSELSEFAETYHKKLKSVFDFDKPTPPPIAPTRKFGIPTDNLESGVKRLADALKWGEPPPTKGSQVVYTELIKDIESRAEFGQQKYGQDLMTDDGRNTLQDIYEELLDMTMYIKKLLMEQENAKKA